MPDSTPDISNCCGQKTAVINSRPTPNGEVRRRRACLTCGRRFSTVERLVLLDNHSEKATPHQP